ncbi:two-component system, NtrC family, C4-dicarboxylate transport sensor histidine kinase DctB [Pseudomonas linyingensis]|uniref:C4-dicarboxylate transport sensor protein DctB n=1 Tax=Pseudomonas linyingensis TaxID=915471 RepID=A0A1H7A7S8_9PSED|nr:ATP-binding protein [Pseudomonas linyingensis]SEJ60986.1 two-component system, NtrC family, C4-dicarboxylate transport sensor histidine kinase DctB [Pseudomonas linyingensis]
MNLQSPSTAERPISLQSARTRVILVVLLILAGLLASVWLAGRAAERRQWAERTVEARGQLELYAQSLRILVERYRSIPAIIALDGEVQAVLRAGPDLLRRQQLNHRLQRLSLEAGAAMVYVLDSEGTAIASSNWDEPTSFIGRNYAFRPYFRDAMRTGGGRYFAVGVTTGVPGYFLAQVVRDLDGSPLGVVVLKLEMEELQRDWAGQPGILLVTDRYGIVQLASRPAWRFRYLQPLGPQLRAELLSARKYAEQTLQPLDVQVLETLEGGDLLRIAGPDGRHDYLSLRQPLVEDGWTLQLLHEARAPDGTSRSYRLAAAGAWLALVFLLLFLAQREKNRRLLQRSRVELERLVDERTAELRQAQDELVQAAKMAALGQMSAALAHEINQPLTAMRMQLGSLGLLLAKGDGAAVQTCLARLDGLLTRMAALTGHLKTFARNSPGGLRERLQPDSVVDHALLLLEPRIRQDDVLVLRRRAADAWVEGDAIRLEQVLVNLLHNALDAMLGKDVRELRIDLQRAGDDWLLEVGDSGGGIAAEDLPRVFEPFFTTKPVGEGLGLGLAVSYGIVRELGGLLEVHNDRDGAVFRIRLPAAAAPVTLRAGAQE